MEPFGEFFQRLYDTSGWNFVIFYDPIEWDRFIAAIWTTIELIVACLAFSLVVGFAGAWAQGANSKIIRNVIAGYLQIFRNTPPFVQILFFYFVVGNLTPSYDAGGYQIAYIGSFGWAVISLIAVLAWGTSDPFGIRQRLDWIVQDQFLKHRPPPEIHPDLLQVSLDDYAAAQFGKNDQRHRMARAIRQLERLGAKTVLVDMLFLDRGSLHSFYQEEAACDGIPDDAVRYGPNLQNRYLEDRLLSDSLSELNQVVIPFHLLAPSAPVQPELRSNLEAMANLLQQNALLKAKDLAERLSIDSRDAMLLYKPACELAANHIARDSNLQDIVDRLEQDILQPPIELTATELS